MADTLISCQQAVVDLRSSSLGLGCQRLHLLGGFLVDTFQLFLFGLQINLALGQHFLSILNRLLFQFDVDPGLLNALLAQFDFELLILDLFGQGIEFPVVADVILLSFVFGNQRFGLIDSILVLLGGFVQLIHFGRNVGNTCIEAGDLVFQVLNLQRKLAFQFVDLVDLRIDFLKLVQRDDLLFHREIVGIAALSA